jgi:hypothetical protein
LASTTLILKIDPLPTFDILYQTGQYLYLHPVVRMAPYFPGVYAAWYYTNNKGTLPFSKVLVTFFFRDQDNYPKFSIFSDGQSVHLDVVRSGVPYSSKLYD